MAEPEDPDKQTAPTPGDDFDDDLVGFSHSRALEGSRMPAPDPDLLDEPEPLPEPEPEAQPEPEPELAPVIEAEPAPAPSFFDPEPEPAPAAPAVAAATVPDDYGRPGATRTFERGGTRPRDEGVTAEGDARMALTLYVFLIGAALTAGLTVVLALALSWLARFMVKGWTASHLLYQLRTSFIGTIAGVIGVLTLPLGLGVFVLSLTVIWVVARGAAGLYRLSRRQPVRDPRTWMLA